MTRLKERQERKTDPSGVFAFHDSWLRLSPTSLPVFPQLLPEGLVLWPRLLCKHAGGEHSGEGGEDEVGGDPVSFLHTALPLYELLGTPGQVRGATFSIRVL